MKHDARDLEIVANRKRFVHELRTTHEAQGRGRFRSLGGQYCAVGLYYYVVLGEDSQRFQLSSKVATHLGLSYDHLWMIMGWNDSGSTFAEIADKFEKADFPISEPPKPRSQAESMQPLELISTDIQKASEFIQKSLEALLALMQSNRETMKLPSALMLSRAVPMQRATSEPPKRQKEQLNRGREKEAGRITLEQWLERYGGDPKAFEHSA